MADTPEPQDGSFFNSSDAQIVHVQRLQALAGLIFTIMAVASFGAAVYFVLRSGGGMVEPITETTGHMFLAILVSNPQASFLLLSAIIGSLLGASLMRASLHAGKKTISDDDRALLEPLITASDDKAISQYVRISSLTGSTGLFTKLGFTGLPLVTASLGVLLILLAMLAPAQHTEEDLMDLAKLVLGAFIGSFVQRQVERTGAGPDEKAAPRPEDML